MACSVPIYYLLHRESPDGVEGLLMEPDLATALADATNPGWRPLRITFGRHTVLEGEELAAAIAERRDHTAEGRGDPADGRDHTAERRGDPAERRDHTAERRATIPENLVATLEGRAA